MVVLHTEPSMQLGPIEMVDRGVVRKITGRAFAAGQVPATVRRLPTSCGTFEKKKTEKICTR